MNLFNWKNPENRPRIVLVTVFAIWILSGLFTYFLFDNWSDRGTFGDMFGHVNSLFSGLAFVGIVYTIFLQVQAIKVDHERRKKEVTILYMNQIRPTYKALLREFEEFEEFGGNKRLNESSLRTILDEENDELRNTLREFLATLEHLAVGANSGVFDKDLIYRMSASYIIRIYDRFQPYITFVQNEGSFSRSKYSEFSDLAHDFRNRKNTGSSPVKGNIKSKILN